MPRPVLEWMSLDKMLLPTDWLPEIRIPSPTLNAIKFPSSACSPPIRLSLPKPTDTPPKPLGKPNSPEASAPILLAVTMVSFTEISIPERLFPDIKF